MEKCEYTIREAKPDDAEAIMGVHRRAILELGIAAYTRAEVESWAAKLRPEGYVKIITERDEYFEVAVDVDGALIGFCSTRENEIMALYVDPDWVRRGVATAFVTRAEERIAAAGHESVIVRAALSGLPFYAARGYVVEKKAEWETRGGLVVQNANLRKTL